MCFFQGFWTNALNPKVALFFLAFVTQFIAAGVENKPLAFRLLDLLFNFNGLWAIVGWALTAAWLGARVSGAIDRRAAPKADEPPRRAERTRSDERGGLFVWIERGARLIFTGFGVQPALGDNP